MHANALTRCVTFVTLCFLRGHFDEFLFRWQCSAKRWYHAGSWCRKVGDILIAARFVLYSFAIWSILMISSFRRFALGPFRGAFHVYKKGFSVAFFWV